MGLYREAGNGNGDYRISGYTLGLVGNQGITCLHPYGGYLGFRAWGSKLSKGRYIWDEIRSITSRGHYCKEVTRSSDFCSDIVARHDDAQIRDVETIRQGKSALCLGRLLLAKTRSYPKGFC